MYIPEAFAEHDESTIRALVVAHPFGALLAPRPDGQIEISHLPFVFDPGAKALRTHVARANPIWREVTSADRRGDVVVVFQGPHGYVSPTWYEEPSASVPTWNYAVVHAHVRMPSILSGPELRVLLGDLTRSYERDPNGWSFDDLEPGPSERMLSAIVGLSLPVERWETKLKLSQNRSRADHARVRAALEARGTADDVEMVALMAARR